MSEPAPPPVLQAPVAPLADMGFLTMPPPPPGYSPLVTLPLEPETSVLRGVESARGRGCGITTMGRGGITFGSFPQSFPRKRPSPSSTSTVTSEADAAAREEEAHQRDKPGMVTPSASATSLSEVESMEQEPPPAKVSRGDEYVGLDPEDSKHLKDTL